ncbi:MFS transporter [Leptospirillum ferriphilum]|uniref:Permease of the major facilitator superfamily n=1 Tax=Leptospirillum ferriphilum (strain ML-04) TaxID=1048260 RepID=J9ZCP7_LEPFM|nr:MFS transporter [Leptospirillum ferriphilum]AFS54385.1 permease of the major facilitator superfamily [Leptospirillum ferriphilum ML-04]MCL5259138.1 MFS transporter [Nitrospirota bacterium]OOH82446.1 MFS transporter [Leptospirillum ferriphilum]
MSETPEISFRSRLGLNLLNFFLGEVIGVAVPFLTDYLKNHHWTFQAIGLATAMIGVGTLLFQAPSGVIAEQVSRHRILTGIVLGVYGLGFSLIPLFTSSEQVTDALLFLSGAASSFFMTLSATLAFSLAGRHRFAQIMGQNQMWNHAGFLVSAMGTSYLIHHQGLAWGFFPIGAGSLLGILSLLLVQKKELVFHQIGKRKTDMKSTEEDLDTIRDSRTLGRVFLDFFRSPAIRVLLISTTLFQIANAPVMPLLLLYLRFLHGGNGKMEWVVFIAQATMIPVAWWAARSSARWGHKLVFSIAFFIMPIRSMICAVSMNTTVLLFTQVLDGVAAGIYGVSVALIVSDLTRGKKGFNMLMGLAQIAMALGAVIGPLLQGVSVGQVGYRFSFMVFAAIAALAAVIFFHSMPHELGGSGGEEKASLPEKLP